MAPKKTSIADAIEELKTSIHETLGLTEDQDIDVSFSIVTVGPADAEDEGDDEEEYDDGEEFPDEEDDEADEEEAEEDEEEEEYEDDEEADEDEADDEESDYYTRKDLEAMTVAQVKEVAKEAGINPGRLGKAALIDQMVD